MYFPEICLWVYEKGRVNARAGWYIPRMTHWVEEEEEKGWKL
jgi:hypothetical protein